MFSSGAMKLVYAYIKDSSFTVRRPTKHTAAAGENANRNKVHFWCAADNVSLYRITIP